MSLSDIIFLSIGLAMDCFAVSTTQAMATRRWVPSVWLMAVLFGFFQGAMPLIGYMFGSLFVDFFSRFAPWIALILLSFIGGKMIWESGHQHKDENNDTQSTFALSHLLILSVATSIDALATGTIFIPVPDRLWLGVGSIALGSFILSLIGYAIGVKAGTHLRFNTEILGGVILIGIGIKIFIQGLCF